MLPDRTGWVASVMLAGLMIGGAGCSSLSQPQSSSFASVAVSGATSGEIQAAVVAVFGEAGYLQARNEGDVMVFEREGSRLDHIAYGSSIGDAPVWSRVRASIVPFAGGSLRLQCQAYVVRDYGAGHMEEEIRLLPLRAGPYQKLLERVAERCAAQEEK